MASPQRISRVRGQLMRELSDIVRRMKDPRLEMVNILDVELSRDLSYAKIFISVMGEEKEDALEGMRNGLGFIRREIAQRMSLRYAPQLNVEYDDTAERAARISSLIDSIGDDQVDSMDNDLNG